MIALGTALWMMTLLGCPKEAPSEPPAPVEAHDDDDEQPFRRAMPVASVDLVESWPSETALDQADIADANQVWPQLIDAATTSLQIGQFYVSPNPDADDHMDTVLARIEAAAARGVTVRLLADAKFQKTYPDDLERLGTIDNIEVRIYDMSELTGGVLHAKYFIVDGRTGYLGSQNFDWRSLEHIQELGVRFDAPKAVAALQAVFEADWAYAGGEGPTWATDQAAELEDSAYDDDVVQLKLIASPKDALPAGVEWDLPVLLDMIGSAKSSVRIQLLNYAVKGYDKVEWRELDDALIAAGARGVDVRITVSNWQKNKYKVGYAKALAKAPGVTVKFVTIPEHSSGHVPFGRTIHSKYMVVDGKRSWVGTSNWSRDYFHGSRNVGLYIEGSAMAERLTRLHQDLWSHEYAETVDPDAEYTPPKVD